GLEIPTRSVVPVRRSRRSRFAVSALVVALAAALVPASLYFLRAPEEKPEIRFEMQLQGLLAGIPVISPDGQRVAYAAQSEGKSAIWIRAMNELKARPLAGTEDGTAPFWSPDSRYLAFFADGRLKKIAVSGGPATTLAETPVRAPGTWSRDGVILF